MRRFAWLLVVVLAAGAHAPAWAQVACLVSGLEGEATLARKGGRGVPVTPFKKLLPGDRVTLGAGARLRLSYLVQGTAEAWSGPVVLAIEAGQARDEAGVLRPAVTSLGVDAAFIRESPLLGGQRELAAGQFAVRGPAATRPEDAALDARGREALRQAQSLYKRNLQALPPGDALAHVLYLAALERLGQRLAMARCIEDLLEKQGPNGELEALLDALHAGVP